jgi:hypothetical protein
MNQSSSKKEEGKIDGLVLRNNLDSNNKEKNNALKNIHIKRDEEFGGGDEDSLSPPNERP